MRLLERTYLIKGLDRVLYSEPPNWREGTFLQEEEDCGHLILRDENISCTAALDAARFRMDQQAEQFRLAISRRARCPLTLKLMMSEEPNFHGPHTTCLASGGIASDSADAVTPPRAPPPKMEQLPEAAARWIQTVAETRSFDRHPDEVLKRFCLIIEELEPLHGSCLDAKLKMRTREVRLVRDFVSHHECDRRDVPPFIASLLPSAIIRVDPTLTVRFDRTSIEHKNFVGRYEVVARSAANLLLDEAIAAMEP